MAKLEANTGEVELSSTVGLTPANQNSSACVAPGRGPNADYFPNVVVQTHDGQKALFYDDLLRNRTVLINSMSIRDRDCAVIRNLLKVQKLLGNRQGTEIFIYSLTTDPDYDNVERLRKFAEVHGVQQGWWLVTGRPQAVDSIRQRLFTHANKEDADAAEDCSMMMMRYGNEKLGIWGSVPGTISPEWIVTRLSWLHPCAVRTGTPVRRGPFPPRNA